MCDGSFWWDQHRFGYNVAVKYFHMRILPNTEFSHIAELMQRYPFHDQLFKDTRRRCL